MNFLSIATLLALCNLISASPFQPRAIKTIYKFMSPMPIAPQTTAYRATDCPDATITNTDDCKVGCTAAPIAAMLGVATDAWSCMSIPSETSWTSVEATSTCSTGSAVKTFTMYGGHVELGCQATA